MSDLQKKFLKSRLPPINIRKREHAKNARVRDYSPTTWEQYFTKKDTIQLEGGRKFQIYLTKEPEQVGPILLLLHGGGYSALTWAHFSMEIVELIHCQCLAIDLRGHGGTKTDNDDDLSADTLAGDIEDLLIKFYPNEMPKIYVIGHSMGGAIAVHFAYRNRFDLIGISVIDVVEGTAMDALASMQSFLRSRPSSFESIPSAIEWCVRSGQIRNIESAKVSMPGQIINCSTKQLATYELPLSKENADLTGFAAYTHPLSITEDDESESSSDNSSKTQLFKKPEDMTKASPRNYTWRIDLSKSEKYWVGWFTGLSEKFLNLHIPKQLLLASIDGLDRTLIVGQMQGKFQMQVLPRCGHAVHEDSPAEVAGVVSSYLIKNRFAQPKGEFHFVLPAC